MYSVIKTEFAYNKEFINIEKLEFKWIDFVNWYNNQRIHGSLGNVSPSEYVPLKSFPD